MRLWFSHMALLPPFLHLFHSWSFFLNVIAVFGDLLFTKKHSLTEHILRQFHSAFKSGTVAWAPETLKFHGIPIFRWKGYSSAINVDWKLRSFKTFQLPQVYFLNAKLPWYRLICLRSCGKFVNCIAWYSCKIGSPFFDFLALYLPRECSSIL